MEKKRKIPILNIAVIGLTAGFIIAGGIVVFANNGNIDNINKKIEVTDKNITDLQAQINEITPEKTVEEAQIPLKSAATAGNKVAELQNKYSVESAETTYYEEISKQIKDYVNEDDSNIWFFRQQEMSGQTYEWKFNTTYSFTDSSTPVLWTCYTTNKDNRQLLAYATSTYNADTNRFASVDVNVTTFGKNFIRESEIDYVGDNSPTDVSTATNNSENTNSNTQPATQSEEDKRLGIYGNVNDILNNYYKTTTAVTTTKSNTTKTTVAETTETTIEIERNEVEVE